MAVKLICVLLMAAILANANGQQKRGTAAGADAGAGAGAGTGTGAGAGTGTGAGAGTGTGALTLETLAKQLQYLNQQVITQTNLIKYFAHIEVGWAVFYDPKTWFKFFNPMSGSMTSYSLVTVYFKQEYPIPPRVITSITGFNDGANAREEVLVNVHKVTKWGVTIRCSTPSDIPSFQSLGVNFQVLPAPLPSVAKKQDTKRSVPDNDETTVGASGGNGQMQEPHLSKAEG